MLVMSGTQISGQVTTAEVHTQVFLLHALSGRRLVGLVVHAS